MIIRSASFVTSLARFDEFPGQGLPEVAMVESLYLNRKNARARSSSGSALTRSCTMPSTRSEYSRTAAVLSLSGDISLSSAIHWLSVSMQS